MISKNQKLNIWFFKFKGRKSNEFNLYPISIQKKNVPLIHKFKYKDHVLSINEIQINHNNVSHPERLGLTLKKGKRYRLSTLGVQLFENKVSFESLFRRQMLRYFSMVSDKTGTRILFPYRTSLKILLETKSINFVEFVFGLYSLVNSSPSAIRDAVENIKYIRSKFPNLEILSETNKPKILKELNTFFGTNFSATDIWAKKTTINNQYIYFRDHLALFNNFIRIEY